MNITLDAKKIISELMSELKPESNQFRLAKILSMYIHQDSVGSNDIASFQVKSGSSIINLSITDIVYIKYVDSNCINIHDVNGRTTYVDGTLKKIEEEYEVYFSKVSRDVLISKERIESIVHSPINNSKSKSPGKNHFVTLIGYNRPIKISKRNVQKIRTLLNAKASIY